MSFIIINIFIVLFLTLIITWLILIKCKNRDIVLHIADLVVKLFTIGGIIGAVYGINIDIRDAELSVSMARSRSKRYLIDSHLTKERYNINPVRTESSPDNYNEIVKDDSSRYYWIEANRDSILIQVEKLEKIEINNYPSCISNSKIFIEDDSLLFKEVNEYNQQVDELNTEKKNLKDLRDNKNLVLFITALILVVSFGVFLSKWYWVLIYRLNTKKGKK